MWANAQFTFDVTPGSALHEDDKDKEALYASTPAPSMTETQPSFMNNDYLLATTSMMLPRLAPAPTEPSSMTVPLLPPTTPAKQKDDQPITPEDDKRRRNTAASARFRQKKKMREQALEQTAKDMSTKCDQLEKRVRELEMEAKWLRALVVEKDPCLLPKTPL
ncbi:hypothetical protein DM01DRAFT_1299940 [Hesseltinella vesiculosa]|uniref:BZIP domain-containing protein n=1 Tax=Hesseltinella vesiculosa TaxID=101127 RepID=A0A1X2GRX3_9FUNG|nr:hypothetical protein DM01DRAFT_1299940 [Hesseltinella vesiculosa]